MFGKIVVLDNTALRSFYQLKLLDKLILLFEAVYVPKRVEQEFLGVASPTEKNKRFDFLITFYAKNKSWFYKCNVYNGSDVLLFKAVLPVDQKKLHDGEIEAAVQRNKLKGLNRWILTDDFNARTIFADSGINVVGTLRVLAELDIRFKLIDYYEVVSILKSEGARYSPEVIKKAYNLALEASR